MQPPEVRQCLIAEHAQFGATATKAGDDRWLVANPVHGGHWGNDAEVAGWTTGAFDAVLVAIVEDQDVEPVAPAAGQ